MLREDLKLTYSPWFDDTVWNTPCDRLELVKEWAELVTETVGWSRTLENAAMRVRSVDLSFGGELRIEVTAAPEGGRQHGPFRYSTDRRLVIEAVMRTIAVRSWRWNAAARSLAPIQLDWRQFLCGIYQPWFDCELSVGDGWADLLLAMAAGLQELTGGPPTHRTPMLQIKEKFGGLRVYHGWKEQAAAAELIAAFEVLSYGICETCGRPGRLHEDHGWLHTACPDHARGRAVRGGRG